MHNLTYLKNVATLVLDGQRCNGCGMCLNVCPHGVFDLSDHKARIVDKDACMECGACARNCSVGALSVRSGVGCAAGVIRGVLTNTEPGCGCTTKAASCN